MSQEWPSFWNKEMETIGEEELYVLHQQKFLRQCKYVFRSSPFYQEKFRNNQRLG